MKKFNIIMFGGSHLYKSSWDEVGYYTIFACSMIH